MKKNINKISTTVKVDTNLYDELKILRIRHKFTLQGFVEKCMYLYINDNTFKETVNNFNLPLLNITGSL
jgi:hypothetical protein